VKKSIDLAMATSYVIVERAPEPVIKLSATSTTFTVTRNALQKGAVMLPEFSIHVSQVDGGKWTGRIVV
jgi:hypothetical protein